MTDITNTVERIEAANPVHSQLPFPSGALSSESLLARIDERSLAMTSTQTPVRPPDAAKPPGRARRSLVAVAVAAALILIIGLTTVSILTGEDNPVVREPQPPATDAPADDAAPPQGTLQEIVNGFIDARNAYSSDDMVSYLAADATVEGDLVTNPAAYAGVVEFERITGWEYTFGTCREYAGVGDQLRLQCPFTYENDWSRALGLGPLGTARSGFTFTVSEDGIERVAMVLDIGEMQTPTSGQDYTAVNDPFVEWLDSTHPDEKWEIFVRTECFPGGACLPRMTSDALVLSEQYSAEFVEFVTSRSDTGS